MIPFGVPSVPPEKRAGCRGRGAGNEILPPSDRRVAGYGGDLPTLHQPEGQFPERGERVGEAGEVQRLEWSAAQRAPESVVQGVEGQGEP